MPETAQTASTVERILALRRLSILETLPPEQLAVVAEQTRERFFPKGAVLLREGEPIAAIYVVLDGKVHVARRGRLLGHAENGAAVGGLGVLAGESEGVSAMAETDTLALELDADAMVEIFEDHFAVLHNVLRRMCRDLVGLLTRAPAALGEGSVPAFDPMPLAPRELDLVERILVLRRGSPFARSSINALAELSRGMAEVRYDPGTTLWEEGEVSGSILLVVRGTVACSARGMLAFKAGPGSPLGAAESMAEIPRWYTPVTETEVVALHGMIEGLIDVFEDNFEMAMDYLAVIARWTLALLERHAGPDEESLERFFGCDHAPDAPT